MVNSLWTPLDGERSLSVRVDPDGAVSEITRGNSTATTSLRIN